MFCDAPGRLTQEHIFGDWLRKLGYNGVGLREIGDPPIVQRGGVFSKKLQIVCASCNNGWMSRLEQDAKPLLIHLFRSHGRSIPLEEDAQLTLARWAFKTAVVCAYADKNQQVEPFPKEHRREFYENDQPPNQAWIRIGMCEIPSDPSKGEHLAAYLLEPSLGVLISGDSSTNIRMYRATIRLLNVVFCILGYVTTATTMKDQPSKEFRTITLPLWPAQRPTIWWPPVAAWRASVDVPRIPGA
ncbi:hypothetical protein [Saccharopolyspora phatthalungensis]|uniref:Uncharacterized protein n=1 Tax=Saccharopolyspora phatthalungensis TaxID=664693 RepID=A0A840QAI4_9PSEU|nr:hypothetical protein [Saccharopolyspora phatthalungensis]MBB5157426.1 hypothetical protein [Saccharopolyspora phatthalungensis]